MSATYTDIIAEAPKEEPLRQHYFIRQLANCFPEQFFAVHQRKPRCCVVTFGCQMNARDSEKILGTLLAIGFEETEDDENADFVLFNTCTVRENANEHLYGRIGRLKQRKKADPDMIVAVCGCMMQEPDEVLKVQQKYPYVDIIFGTHNVYALAELLAGFLAKRVDAGLRKNSQKRVVEVRDKAERIVEELPNARKYPFKQGVNISYGCNNFCTYCIVPYVRGRERSRRSADILREIRELAQDGVSEIMLLGQNVNSYGNDKKDELSFPALLREVCRVEGIRRIRFMTSHPKDLSDELIRVMAEEPKICRHLHLPLQSGSSRILKAMNRRYTQETYLTLVSKIKAHIPDICLTTDIIVGFPGETEEDFCETLSVAEKVRYSSVFTFIYSKRTGTPAAAMPHQVPEEIVKDRFDRLLAVTGRIAREECKKDEGSVAEVLVEEINDPRDGLLTGRLSNNLLVHFPGGPSLVGTYQQVRLNESKGFYYVGTVEGNQSV